MVPEAARLATCPSMLVIVHAPHFAKTCAVWWKKPALHGESQKRHVCECAIQCESLKA